MEKIQEELERSGMTSVVGSIHGQAGGEKIKLKFQHSLDGWRPGGGTVPAWSPLCSL